MTFFDFAQKGLLVDVPTTRTPPYPLATVLSFQPPSPFCHPDRSVAKGRDLQCATRVPLIPFKPPFLFLSSRLPRRAVGPDPDFLPRSAGHGGVCCLRQGRQHEVHQRHQVPQGIRGSGGTCGSADLPWKRSARNTEYPPFIPADPAIRKRQPPFDAPAIMKEARYDRSTAWTCFTRPGEK